MAVYVDNMAVRYGRMIMYHLIADTSEELLEMVDRIGVPRKWIQHSGTYAEHFDICKSKRRLAISAGAVPISWRQYGERVMARRDAELGADRWER